MSRHTVHGTKKFLSTPSARRATRLRPRAAFAQKFLSTPSARRATCRGEPHDIAAMYFYPRPPRGGRPKLWGIRATSSKFLSTPSARRATGRIGGKTETGKFLSTPSARRATY